MDRAPTTTMTTRLAPEGARLLAAARLGRMTAETQQPKAPPPSEAVLQQPAPPVDAAPAQPQQQPEEEHPAEERQGENGQQPEVPPSGPAPLSTAARSFGSIDASAIYARLNGQAQSLQTAASGATSKLTPHPSLVALGGPPRQSGQKGGANPNDLYRRINEATIWKKD